MPHCPHRHAGHFGFTGTVTLPAANPRYTKELGDICHVLIVDSAAYTKLSKAVLKAWTVAVLEDPPYPRSLVKSLSVVKILGGHLFPRSVQRTLYFDPKLHVRQTPATMFRLLSDSAAQSYSLAAFERTPERSPSSLGDIEDHISRTRRRQRLRQQQGKASAFSSYLRGLERQRRVRALLRNRLSC